MNKKYYTTRDVVKQIKKRRTELTRLRLWLKKFPGNENETLRSRQKLSRIVHRMNVDMNDEILCIPSGIKMTQEEFNRYINNCYFYMYPDDIVTFIR